MSAVKALLTGLIDYAGLFPPAALEMEAAVRQYAEYRRGGEAWVLGRFIVPLSRLGELRAAGSAEWKLSVLLLPGESAPAEIDSVEMKIDRAEDIRRLSPLLPPLRYFEIPIAADPHPGVAPNLAVGDLVAALGETGGRAKVRTGGSTPEAQPGKAELARFLCECAAARVPFKATAGLHHAIATPGTHGFINLFLAAVWAYQGGTQEEVAATLEETSARAFAWDRDGVSWHGHRLSTEQIATAREEFAIAFGSCSFEEPIGDLKALGWL
jgi:hypothetical protein